jgi:formyl-CoA transferase/CoA:oxalate CoA-transferase
MQHALMSALTTRLAQYWATGIEPERLGGSHSAVAPYNVFATKDGYMVAGVWGAGEAWPRFCEAIERPELVDDPRFLTNLERVANRSILNPLLEAITVTRTTLEWQQRFRAQHVLFGPVLGFDALFADPNVVAQHLKESVEHPTAGPIPQLAPVVRMGDTPGEILRHPPRLGEHTEEVLAEAGYSAHEIQTMVDGGLAQVASAVEATVRA